MKVVPDIIASASDRPSVISSNENQSPQMITGSDVTGNTEDLGDRLEAVIQDAETLRV